MFALAEDELFVQIIPGFMTSLGLLCSSQIHSSFCGWQWMAGVCVHVWVCGGVVLTYPKVGSPASKGPLAQINYTGGWR